MASVSVMILTRRRRNLLWLAARGKVEWLPSVGWGCRGWWVSQRVAGWLDRRTLDRLEREGLIWVVDGKALITPAGARRVASVWLKV